MSRQKQSSEAWRNYALGIANDEDHAAFGSHAVDDWEFTRDRGDAVFEAAHRTQNRIYALEIDRTNGRLSIYQRPRRARKKPAQEESPLFSVTPCALFCHEGSHKQAGGVQLAKAIRRVIGDRLFTGTLEHSYAQDGSWHDTEIELHDGRSFGITGRFGNSVKNSRVLENPVHFGVGMPFTVDAFRGTTSRQIGAVLLLAKKLPGEEGPIEAHNEIAIRLPIGMKMMPPQTSPLMEVPIRGDKPEVLFEVVKAEIRRIVGDNII